MKTSDNWRNEVDIHFRVPANHIVITGKNGNNKGAPRALLIALLTTGAGIIFVESLNNNSRIISHSRGESIHSVSSYVVPLPVSRSGKKPIIRRASVQLDSPQLRDRRAPRKKSGSHDPRLRPSGQLSPLSHKQDLKSSELSILESNFSNEINITSRSQIGFSKFGDEINLHPNLNHSAEKASLQKIRGDAIELAEKIRNEALTDNISDQSDGESTDRSDGHDHIESSLDEISLSTTDKLPDRFQSIDPVRGSVPTIDKQIQQVSSNQTAQNALKYRPAQFEESRPSGNEPSGPEIAVNRVYSDQLPQAIEDNQATGSPGTFFSTDGGRTAKPEDYTSLDESVGAAELRQQSAQAKQVPNGVEFRPMAIVNNVSVGRLPVLIRGALIDHPDHFAEGFYVRLSDIIILLKSRLAPDVYDKMMGAKDSGRYLSFSALRSYGISVAFDHQDRLVVKSI